MLTLRIMYRPAEFQRQKFNGLKMADDARSHRSRSRFFNDVIWQVYQPRVTREQWR